jgi:hypothetical protein
MRVSWGKRGVGDEVGGGDLVRPLVGATPVGKGQNRGVQPRENEGKTN